MNKAFHLEKMSTKTYGLMFVMLLFQIVWLIAIWLTGASSDSMKLLIIGISSVASYSVVAKLPQSVLTRAKAARERLVNDQRLALVCLIVLIVLVGVVYVNFQRLWTWDEEYSFRSSSIVAQEGVGALFKNYASFPWLGKQHPPLVPLMNGLTMRFLGVNLSIIRYVSLLFLIGVVIITYFLGRELYDPETGLLGAVFLISFPLMIRLGTAGLTDVQVTFFLSLSVLLTLRLLRTRSLGLALFLGVVLAAGLLTKYTMMFGYAVLLSIILVKRKLWQLKYHLGVALFLSSLIFLAWGLYASSIGVTVPGISTLIETSRKTISVEEVSETAGGNDTFNMRPGWILSNIGGIRWTLNSIGTRLTSAIGVFNLPLMFLGLRQLLYRRTKSDLIVLFWMITLSMILVLTLPDHRYFMPMFPALAIGMALWLKNNPEAIDRVILLTLLFWGSALYLFVDWYREGNLFVE